MLLSLSAIAVSAQLRSWPNRRLDDDTSDALAEIEAAAMQESPKVLPPPFHPVLPTAISQKSEAEKNSDKGLQLATRLL